MICSWSDAHEPHVVIEAIVGGGHGHPPQVTYVCPGRPTTPREEA